MRLKEQSGATLLELMIVVAIVAVIVSILVGITGTSGGSDSSNQDYIRLVEDQGYTNVHVLGTAVFGCSDSDSIIYNRKFEATSKATGRHVTGVVCGGFLKGKTVRFD